MAGPRSAESRLRSRQNFRRRKWNCGLSARILGKTSGFGGKADIARAAGNVRLCCKAALRSAYQSCQSPFNLNDRALLAILARVRACSAVPADTFSRAVPANTKRLLPSAPEPDPTRDSGETNPTFRNVSACATPCVSDPQDQRPLRLHVRIRSVQTPHGPDE
jgi:hypothetical protein